MVVVNIHSDFWAQEEKICWGRISPLLLPFLLSIAIKWWGWMPHLSFFKYWVLSWLFHFPLSLSSTGFLVTLRFLPLEWYHLHIWGCFSQQSWFQLVMCSACKLNKLGDNIQPCIHFSILNQSVVPYKVLIVASRSAYRFLETCKMV